VGHKGVYASLRRAMGAGTAFRRARDSRAPCLPGTVRPAPDAVGGHGVREFVVSWITVPAPLPTLRAAQLHASPAWQWRPIV